MQRLRLAVVTLDSLAVTGWALGLLDAKSMRRLRLAVVTLDSLAVTTWALLNAWSMRLGTDALSIDVPAVALRVHLTLRLTNCG
jgi:hypothetical protein